MSSQSFTNDKFKTSVIAVTLLAGLSLPANAGLFHRSDSTTTTTSNTGGGTTSTSTTSTSAPGSDYLAGATNRVNKAKTQLDTAKKQLTAAKALVKAAQAEFNAAQADKEALALKTTAQGLASDSGLQTGSAPAGADATSGLPPVAPMPGAAAGTTPTTPAGDIGAQDFSGAPTGTAPMPSPPAATGSTDPSALR